MRGTLILTAALVGSAVVACVEPWEPPPANLEARGEALEEVIKQRAVIDEADSGVAAPLLTHKDHRVRRAAAMRLADLGERSSGHLPELVKMLDDEHPEARIAALRALVAIGGEDTHDPLIDGLTDQDRRVRVWAWKSIVATGEPIYPRLIWALGKECTIYGFFKNEAGLKLGVKAQLRSNLPTIGKPIVPYLVAGLKNEDDWRNVNSATVLGSLKDKAIEALPSLAERLHDNTYPKLRVRIIRTMVAIGDKDPSVVPALKKASDDPDKKVAGQASKALKDLEKAAKREAQERRDRKKKHTKAKKAKPPKPKK